MPSETTSLRDCELSFGQNDGEKYTIQICGICPHSLKELCMNTVIFHSRKKFGKPSDPAAKFLFTRYSCHLDNTFTDDRQDIWPIFNTLTITVENVAHFFESNVEIACLPKKLEAEINSYRNCCNANIVGRCLENLYKEQIRDEADPAPRFPLEYVRWWLYNIKDVEDRIVHGAMEPYYKTFDSWLEYLREEFLFKMDACKDCLLGLTVIQHTLANEFKCNVLHFWFGNKVLDYVIND